MSDFDRITSHAVGIRHDIHRRPELGFAEFDTAAVVRRELDLLGIAWRACAGTGTVARLAAHRPGPAIAFRADLDALPMDENSGVPWTSEIPGRMHACGHDGHTASLISAAAWLKIHEAALSQPVVLIFQPAEEWGNGAVNMVEDGALDGVSCIYGYHNWPPMDFGTAACPDGTVMAANGSWKAIITGRGGHAAAPHECIDPIVAGSTFVTTVQQIVARQVAAQASAVVTVTRFHGGTADNIIPDAVELTGTVRAMTSEQRADLVVRLEAYLAAACAPLGASYTFSFKPLYGATINHPGPAAHARAALIRVLGDACLSNTGIPLMGSEDFSYYLTKIPGAFLLLGGGTSGKHTPGCHSPHFDFNDRLIPVVTRLWATLAGLPSASAREQAH